MIDVSADLLAHVEHIVNEIVAQSLVWIVWAYNFAVLEMNIGDVKK
ncbi:hypothetical protein [Bradyrhizobium tunisiense]